MKIIKNKGYKLFEIEVKRFYIPFSVETNCPRCNTVQTQNLEVDYLSYPTVGNPIDLDFYCGACEHEFSEKVKLEINLTKG